MGSDDDAMPVIRWNDDRLDEMNARLRTVEPVVIDVAVIKTELANLANAMRANTKATEKVTAQLEDTKIEPLTRARDARQRVLIAISCTNSTRPRRARCRKSPNV